jgi:hypothetical protein
MAGKGDLLLDSVSRRHFRPQHAGQLRADEAADPASMLVCRYIPHLLFQNNLETGLELKRPGTKKKKTREGTNKSQPHQTLLPYRRR